MTVTIEVPISCACTALPAAHTSDPRACNRYTLLIRFPIPSWIGNAYTALFGQHGDVSRQAHEAGCSRQTVYDHAAKVPVALAEAQRPGPTREQLLADNQRLILENQQLWDALDQSIDCPEDKLQQFATTGNSLGLSLSQILLLLAVLLPASRLPSRATLGRWVQQQAKRARRVLAVLDQACRRLVSALCLDEIFVHRRPVLMAVEPHSLLPFTHDLALVYQSDNKSS